MKLIFTIFSLLIYTELVSQSTLNGRVQNVGSAHDTAFKLVFIKDGKRLDSTQTHLSGYYKLSLPSGKYVVEISKKNKVPQLVKNINLVAARQSINFTLDFNLSKNSFSNIKTDSVRLKEERIVEVSTVADTKMISKKTRTSKAKISGTSGSGSGSGAGVGHHVKPALRESVSFDTDAAYKSADMDGVGLEHSEKENVSVGAGVVTAGIWRDLDHWNEWLKTNETQEIQSIQKLWGYYPLNTLRLKFNTKWGEALTYTKVILMDKSAKTIWETYTDVKGEAWFWPGINQSGFKLNPDEYTARIESKFGIKTYDKLGKYFNSELALKTDYENEQSMKIELGFIVDATGSMGDEISFLQAELVDVVSKVARVNPCLQIMTGSVFYKDNNDEYITRISPLDNNPVNTINFIGKQSAGGGGDFPEAIDVALKDALNKLNWGTGSNPRIMFLILDAPPHSDTASKARMRKCSREAAARGITIIPITASGIDKATEFLMKYLAISTNGNYVYITDDSRIGNSHLKPTGGTSDVKLLNNILTGLINDACKNMKCESNSITLNDKDSVPDHYDTLAAIHDSLTNIRTSQELVIGEDWFLKFYPNPCASILKLEFSDSTESIRICDISGKTIYESECFGFSERELNVSEWSSGIYIVYAIRRNKMLSGRLLVMH